MTGSKPNRLSDNITSLSPTLTEWELPTRRQEPFRYNNLTRLQNLEKFEVGAWSVELEGHPEDLSRLRLARLSTSAKSEKLQGLLVQAPLQSFGHLNRGLEQDPYILSVPPGLTLERGLTLKYRVSEKAETLSCPAIYIIVGAGAKLLVQEFFQTAAENILVAGLTRIRVGEQAELEHVRFLRSRSLQFHEVFALVESRAKYQSVNVTIGSGRTDHHVWLMQNEAECALRGLFKAVAQEEADFHTVIEHRAPETRSTQFYKGILDGEARGIFNGRIHIFPQAQKSLAEQVNKNLLLSDRAEIDTKPELQISADDVKAAHGATVGQIDSEQLFYLVSRGISPADARALLIQGFTQEIIDMISIKEWRDSIVQGGL